MLFVCALTNVALNLAKRAPKHHKSIILPSSSSLSSLSSLSLIFCRNLSSKPSNPIVNWLINDRGVDPNIVDLIIKSFPSTPSIKDIQGLGESGLIALIDAVIREQKSLSKGMKYVRVNFQFPKAKELVPLTLLEEDNLYTFSRRNALLGEYMECACSGIAACTTCHVILKEEDMNKFSPPDEAELDILDYTAGSTTTSRLGCQLTFTERCQGITIRLPDEVNNLY